MEIKYNCKPSLALEEQEDNFNYLRLTKSELIAESNKLVSIRKNFIKSVQSSKRNIDIKDHSAKSKIDGARVTGKDKRSGRKVTTINSKIRQNQQKIDC